MIQDTSILTTASYSTYIFDSGKLLPFILYRVIFCCSVASTILLLLAEQELLQ